MLLVRDSQTNQGDMHGDIVVDIDTSGTTPFAEVIGGNVGDSVPWGSETRIHDRAAP